MKPKVKETMGKCHIIDILCNHIKGNKKGIGFIGITLIVIGLVALYFIFKSELIGEFINFVKGFF